MKFTRTVKLAIKSIMSSKARSFLTMLGIIIGVSAVIVIVGIGNGMQNYLTEQFKSMGTNLLTVSIRGRGSTRSVSVDDMYAIAEENKDVFGGLSPYVPVAASVKIGGEELDDTSVVGVGEDYLSMKNIKLDAGRAILYADNLSRSKVCVVGSYISRVWFGGNAVGQTLKLNGDRFQIVGVLEELAESEEGSTDDCVYLPYTTALKLMGTRTVSTYYFEMLSEDNVQHSKDIIYTALYNRFGSGDSFTIISMSEILSTMNEIIGVVITVLSIIAGISLLVGGIGIMNIMLVSVSERTREIGIRKALGAKRRNILLQFVIEAGTTSVIGGAIGILFGYLLSSVGTSIITSMLETELVIAPSVGSVIMAVGVSAGVRVLFGYLPARKAAYLNPIDALRFE